MPERTHDADADSVDSRRAWIRGALAQHERPLILYAARLLGDDELARDVVQETFLRMWQADRPAIEGHLAAWLYTVCRNRALDVKKKDRRMQPVSDPRPTTGASQTPFEVVARKEASGHALRALAHLPERQQELVRLKFQGGLSYREIAEITGLSVSNVGYLLHIAIKAVRTELGSAS